MNFKKQALLFIISLFFILFFADFIKAQVKNKDTIKVVPSSFKGSKKAEAEIDSLLNVINENKAAYDNVVLSNNKKDSVLNNLDEKILTLQNANGVLEKKLSGFKGENLKLDQSNRILIIFNSIVGVLLLSTLVWFLRNIGRKKTVDKTSTAASYETTSTNEINPASTTRTNHQYFENKLEQLEKLGKLKEKGILNEDEFNKQKQQILGNNS